MYSSNLSFFTMDKTILTFFIICFLAVTSSAQMIEIREMDVNSEDYTLLDFGNIRAKKTTKKELILINTGDHPLIIDKVEEGCDCTKVKLKKKILVPNEKAKLYLKWKPIDNNEFHSSIMIHSNAKNHPNLWIQMEGNVTHD